MPETYEKRVHETVGTNIRYNVHKYLFVHLVELNMRSLFFQICNYTPELAKSTTVILLHGNFCDIWNIETCWELKLISLKLWNIDF